jgi:hypothetical protein
MYSHNGLFIVGVDRIEGFAFYTLNELVVDKPGVYILVRAQIAFG